MINYVFPLWAAFFESGIIPYVLAPIVALAFIATVPAVLRYFVMGR